METIIIDFRWFKSNKCIGMVVVKILNGWECYIGRVEAEKDENFNALCIANYGAKLPKEIAIGAFPYLINEKCAYDD